LSVGMRKAVKTFLCAIVSGVGIGRGGDASDSHRKGRREREGNRREAVSQIVDALFSPFFMKNPGDQERDFEVSWGAGTGNCIEMTQYRDCRGVGVSKRHTTRRGSQVLDLAALGDNLHMIVDIGFMEVVFWDSRNGLGLAYDWKSWGGLASQGCILF